MSNKAKSEKPRLMTSRTIESPVGRLLAIASNGKLIALAFPANRKTVTSQLTRQGFAATKNKTSATDEGVLDRVAGELELYFAGRLRKFSIPMGTNGTEFQEEVWGALRRIRWDTTTTYGDLARELKRPGSARAIGMANAKNPIAIIIPCHRVTGAGNKIKGFAGGSAAVRGLLAIERKQPTGKGGSKDSHDH